MTRPTLIDLNPDKYNHGLCCYSFMVNLDRCKRICKTYRHLSSSICVPNKTENTNINVFKMITGTNELINCVQVSEKIQ